MSDLNVVAWGAGEPVVLVHSSFGWGIESWAWQRPLAERYRLLLLDRRGFGRSASGERENFQVDARGNQAVERLIGRLQSLFARATDTTPEDFYLDFLLTVMSRTDQLPAVQRFACWGEIVSRAWVPITVLVPHALLPFSMDEVGQLTAVRVPGRRPAAPPQTHLVRPIPAAEQKRSGSRSAARTSANRASSQTPSRSRKTTAPASLTGA